MMIDHHTGAIEMAREVRKSGSDLEVKKLAADIEKTQQAEIETLKSFSAGADRRTGVLSDRAPLRPRLHHAASQGTKGSATRDAIVARPTVIASRREAG